jgi:hypothetical protein
VEKITHRSIKCLRTNNFGEFKSMKFENYSKEFGMIGIKPLHIILGKTNLLNA